MPTLGIEMCDAAFQAALGTGNESKLLTITDGGSAPDWPGYAYHDGQRFVFGRAAEDAWFVHPRRVAHTFWSRLSHEASTLGPIGKTASFSELCFHYLREFQDRVIAAGTPFDKIVLAVPGA